MLPTPQKKNVEAVFGKVSFLQHKSVKNKEKVVLGAFFDSYSIKNSTKNRKKCLKTHKFFRPLKAKSSFFGIRGKGGNVRA